MKQSRTFSWIYLNQFSIDYVNQPRDWQRQSEDYVLVDSRTGLLGVFDSVGGRDNGLLVSHLAGETIAAVWRSLWDAEQERSPAQLEASLQALIRQADTTIASLVLPSGQRRPATTVALGVLSLQQERAYLSIAHVGDSRVYLLREGQSLQRLTEDNGYFSHMVRHGRMTKEEALCIEQAEQESALSPREQTHFAQRNRITCAVGWTDFSAIQTRSLGLVPGDRILFCTDGVHDNLTDLEIEEELQGSDETGVQCLVSAAYQRSLGTHFRAKRDDVSAIIAQYRC